ncbi:hypothetical protein [Dactylosporangium sp. CS-033363]|uniref:hypothetical protein n=1 Tax=Dactylosporangium sp. CS-033363 TaxID=3239935 RepID=UPI003D8D5EA7
MKLSKSHLGAGALALGAVLAFAVPAGAAVNLQSESNGTSALKIVKQAKLKANGAATVVTLNITCPSGDYYDLNVSVTQTIGNKTTTGTGYAPRTECTGYTQKVKVPVTVSGGGAPFKQGDAYAVGNANVYGFDYLQLSTGRVIVNVES